MWSIWDKKSDINGFSAEWFLNRHQSLAKEETIFIKTVNGRVTQTEGKGILAHHYGIDPTLPDEEFIAAYEAKLAELNAAAEAEETNNAEE